MSTHPLLHARPTVLLVFLGVACAAEPQGRTAGHGGDALPSDPHAGDEDGCGAGDDPPSQDELRLGSSRTFEVLTWNLANFPRSEWSVPRIADLISRFDVDLIAVQEIADLDAFDELLEALPEFSGVTSPDSYETGTYQKTGFLYRTSELILGSVSPLFESDPYDFPRPPLEAHFEEVKRDCTRRSIIAIVAHLKAGIEAEDANRRRQAVVELKGRIDALLLAGEMHVFLLGDFNDEPDDPAAENAFNALLNDPGDYTVLTLPLARDGVYSYIPYPSLLDQIIITHELLDDYRARTEVLSLDELITTYNYAATVTDHRPVVSFFSR